MAKVNRIPFMSETEKISEVLLISGKYELLYESTDTGSFPMNTFKILSQKYPCVFKKLMLSLQNRGKLNRDNGNSHLNNTTLFYNEEINVSRFCLIDEDYNTIQSESEKSKWYTGADAIEYEGHKYHIYKSYEAHDKPGSNDLRINDFAMTLHAISSGECFISFMGNGTPPTEAKRYDIKLWGRKKQYQELEKELVPLISGHDKETYTKEQLVNILKIMREEGDASTKLKLFGIMYAPHIGRDGISTSDIAKDATGSENNGREIDKGRALGLYFRQYIKTENSPVTYSGSTLQLDLTTLCSAIKRTGLLYEDKLIQRYACSLMTKPFVILSGLAGSGKTQLALAFARAMSEDADQQLCVVPVGADWTNREPLLGYPNALKQGEYMQPESGALQIMMRALRNPQKPYFLVLDEMNLSYVERYFADFLSALESNQKIPLWEKPDECDSEVDASIALPKNLFIVGTINVDETTYMFSPKVLDRANVIEFKISDTEMEQFLGQDMNIDVHAADGACANMAQDFVQKATSKETDNSELAQKTLLEFFKVLKKVNAEFGYRSATEIYRFIANAKACAEGMTEDEILDAAIVQKLLPKLHGSRKKLEPALKALWGLCMTDDHKTEAITRENAEQYAKFVEAADKIQRMMQTALDNGFTSFAEA